MVFHTHQKQIVSPKLHGVEITTGKIRWSTSYVKYHGQMVY